MNSAKTLVLPDNFRPNVYNKMLRFTDFDSDGKFVASHEFELAPDSMVRYDAWTIRYRYFPNDNVSFWYIDNGIKMVEISKYVGRSKMSVASVLLSSPMDDFLSFSSFDEAKRVFYKNKIDEDEKCPAFRWGNRLID